MSGGHFVYVCEYGESHGQCRCPSSNKVVRRVTCDVPQKHAQKQATKEQAIEKRLIVTVDLDSTLCNTGHRHKLVNQEDKSLTDWEAYSLACADDAPVKGVIEVVKMLSKVAEIHIVSGRAASAAKLTEEWLGKHGVPVTKVWLDETDQKAGGWSAAHASHEAYKVSRIRDVERLTGKRVALHFDDWSSVAMELERWGIPCVCVRTPQEIEEQVAGDAALR